MNRAGDGFLPYYDGSYTWDPTKLLQDEQGAFVTSISLLSKNNGSVRVLMTYDSLSGTWVLQRRREKGVGVYSTMAFPGDHQQYSITWTHHIRCRMPSKSMPWMTQRLLWEEWHSEEDKENSEDVKPAWPSDTCSYCQPPTKLLSLRQLEQDWDFCHNGCWVDATSEDEKDTPKISLSAVACQNVVHATCREYALSNGQLVSVLWSHGIITMVDDEP